MTTLPAESPTLEANFVMAPTTLQDPNTLSASFATFTLMELEASLHELLLSTEKLVYLLEVFVGSIYLSHSLEKFIHLFGTLSLQLNQRSFFYFDCFCLFI